MLDRVHLRGVHDRFPVGGGHAKVEGRDHGIAEPVFPGDVNAGLENKVVDRKACDLFKGIVTHGRILRFH